MLGFLSGGIGAGLGQIGSSLLGGVFGHSANQKMVELKNRDFRFNKWVTKNAHQIEVRDLLKAGLNPMLSFRGGGANSGGGGGIPNLQNEGMAVSSAMSAAIERRAMEAGIRKTEAETTAALASAKEINTRADLLGTYGSREKEASLGLTGQQTGEAHARTAESAQRTQNLIAELPRVAAEIRNLDKRSELTDYETNAVITKNRLANLDIQQQTAMMPALIGLIANDFERSNLTMQGYKNANAAEDTWWRKMLAWMGFSRDQQDNMLQQAITGPTLRRLPK